MTSPELGYGAKSKQNLKSRSQKEPQMNAPSKRKLTRALGLLTFVFLALTGCANNAPLDTLDQPEENLKVLVTL